MRRISAHLFIALFTFAIGVAAFAVRHFVRSPHSRSADPQQVVHITATSVTATQGPGFYVRYESTAINGGLFNVVRSSDGYLIDSTDRYDARVLVLPYNDNSIKPKADGSKAPTHPGFYLSNNVRMDFASVEAIGKRVNFTTRRDSGVSYEFSGTSGEEIIPHFSPPTSVPFIKGILKKLRDGEVIGEEEIKFRFAVTD